MSLIEKPLTRQSTIQHPSGIKVTTPLLIPSFSSKGFRVNRKGESEAQAAIDVASEWITDVMLVSAYDLHHGLINRPDTYRGTPELIVVDSGGYESRVEHDMSTAVHTPHTSLSWDESKLKNELDQWDNRFPAVFVSYDSPDIHLTLDEQLQKAKDLFLDYPTQLHTFLLKPTTEDQVYLRLVIEEIKNDPKKLDGFDFIGVTEKELGKSPLDRMMTIADLRMALDRVSILTPIHVFGALDPMTSSLYFLAGAEVFDGLTWLRYGFNDSVSIYQLNFGFLTNDLDQIDKLMRARMLTSNVFALGRLRNQMQQFILDGNFSRFVDIGSRLESHFDLFRAKVNA